ncbi:MAG: hypothetical protein IB618_02740 [Candidatus Pacearchaeota archaeon]|nr:MAG: hypothetical protein IB618_02740 [Candidatus Pacearchaeota archaeon]
MKENVRAFVKIVPEIFNMIEPKVRISSIAGQEGFTDLRFSLKIRRMSIK